jgi:hypothetical protein
MTNKLKTAIYVIVHELDREAETIHVIGIVHGAQDR